MVNGHDAALTDRREDLLGRWGVARAIHRVICGAPKNWSTRVGLYGKWGTGKTSVLNFLRQIESEANSLVVTVSAWSAIAESGVVELLYSELSAELSRKKVKLPRFHLARRWASKIPGMRVAQGLSAVAVAALNLGTPGSGELASSAGKVVASRLRFSKSDVEALMSATRNAGFERIVIFVDDLDRADPRVLPGTLLALRELLDWPGLSFVLAFDRDVVADALVNYSRSFGDSADRFLEKIVDVAFSISEPTSEQSQALAMQALATCAPFLERGVAEELSRFAPSNPRTAKLVARSVGALAAVAERHDPQEVDWLMVGLQQTLRCVAPDVAIALERELTVGPDSTTPEYSAPRFPWTRS